MDKLIKIRLKKFINENYYSNSGRCNFYNKDVEPTTDPDKVHIIHLQHINCTEIPDEIFYFMNLEKLILYHPIKKLDERLAEISPLKKLNIHSDFNINENNPIIKKLRNKGVEVNTP